jgi:hypothetical protein
MWVAGRWDHSAARFDRYKAEFNFAAIPVALLPQVKPTPLTPAGLSWRRFPEEGRRPDRSCFSKFDGVSSKNDAIVLML